MGMEFEGKRRVAGTPEAELAKAKAEIAELEKEQAEVNAQNTQRIKDLQNIVADMVEGGEA